MIKSMTGFGKGQLQLPEKNLTFEIKSLNSKQLDMSTRIPQLYRQKELEIRNLLGQKLLRGKIEFLIQVEYTGSESFYSINQELATKYYKELRDLAEKTGQVNNPDYLGIIVKMPDVLKTMPEEIDNAEWSKVLNTINLTLDEIDLFRLDEGKALENDLSKRIQYISKNLTSIENQDSERIDKIKKRLESSLEELRGDINFDPNRLEQEIIYYIEKLDITEEKVRLRKHCDYFLETMQAPPPNGRKLSFISQEIGREINTLGAKANDARIQKIVVEMKDDLEKIKEQLMNVL